MQHIHMYIFHVYIYIYIYIGLLESNLIFGRQDEADDPWDSAPRVEGPFALIQIFGVGNSHGEKMLVYKMPVISHGDFNYLATCQQVLPCGESRDSVNGSLNFDWRQKKTSNCWSSFFLLHHLNYDYDVL